MRPKVKLIIMENNMNLKQALKKWEGSSADKANDRKKGIKEGSKRDIKEDLKGAKKLMKHMGSHPLGQKY